MNKNVRNYEKGNRVAVHTGDHVAVSTDQHNDGSLRKYFSFKCNHCSYQFKRKELRNQRKTVQHKCESGKPLTRKIGMKSRKCKNKHVSLPCLQLVNTDVSDIKEISSDKFRGNVNIDQIIGESDLANVVDANVTDVALSPLRLSGSRRLSSGMEILCNKNSYPAVDRGIPNDCKNNRGHANIDQLIIGQSEQVVDANYQSVVLSPVELSGAWRNDTLLEQVGNMI